MEFNSQFNLQNVLDSQLKMRQWSTGGDFAQFTDFGSRFISKAAELLEGSSVSEKDVQRIDSLVNRLYQVLLLKQQTQLKFEPLQRQAGNDEIRFQMMKLHLTYESLTAESKALVDSYARPNHADFKSLLQSTVQSIPTSDNASQSKLD